MTNRFHDILEAAMKRDRRQLARYSKADFFADDPAAIQAGSVLQCIDDIVELLAQRGEFITEAEWLEPRHGFERNKSLRDLAGYQADNLLFENGYVCTHRTRDRVPKTPHGKPLASESRFPRTGVQQPATERDNINFWFACESGDIEQAITIWRERDVNVDFEYKMHGDKERLTPIAAAARQGHDISVLFLLEAGANPDSRSKSNITPAMMAAMHCHDSTVILLVDGLVNYYRGQPDEFLKAIQTRERDILNSVYDYAVSSCSSETARYILDALTRAISGDPETTSDIPEDLETMAAFIRDAVDRRKALADNPPPRPKPRVTQMPFQAPPVQAIPEIPDLTPPPPEPEWMRTAKSGSLTKAQIMTPCDNGKTLLRNAIEAGILGTVVKGLIASGEKVTAEELVHRGDQASGKTNLEIIAATQQLGQLFTPALWVSNVREMQQIWASIPQQYQTQLDGQEGRPSFRRLFQQTNADSLKNLQSKPGDVLSLIAQKPAQSAQPGIAEATDAPLAKTPLRIAIDTGTLSDFVTKLIASGEKLTVPELTHYGDPASSMTNLEAIAQTQQLPQLFTPELWVNNVREMQQAWARVPREHQAQLDGLEGRPSFKQIFQQVNADSLKSLQTVARTLE